MLWRSLEKSIIFYTDLYTPGLVIEFSAGRILCEPAGGCPELVRKRSEQKGPEISRPFLRRPPAGPRRAIDLEEREVARGAEVHDVRNDERHVGVAYAQPARERRGVLVDGDARHRVSLPDVDAGAEGGRSESPVYFVADDRTAEHEVMRAPAVIRPVAVRCERASEIGGGEDRHVVLHAHLPEPAVERVHRGVRDRQLLGVLGEEEVVTVEAAETDQEHLPVRPDGAPRGNDAG